ncbi:MAG TPA: ATP-binding protein [Candidatus Saccharimonadia bacterium]|nr:ATP-binding protein [Candidatus Saccharimonadia bacterium]
MHILTSLTYIPVIVAIVIVAAATFIYRSQKYLAYFSALVFITALWLLCQYIAQMSILNDRALWTIRISSALSGLIAYFFLLFATSYTGYRRWRTVRNFCILPILAFAPLNFTNLMIQRVVTSSSGISVKSAGTLYLVQILVISLYFVGGIVELVRSTLKAPRYARGKDYLLIFGVAQAVVLIIIAATVFASSDKAQIILPIAILLMVLIVAFAVIRHRLFDIRTVVAKTLIYLTSILFLGIVYGAIFLVVAGVIFHVSMKLDVQLLLGTASAIVSISFASFKDRFDRLTSRIFFQDSYDAQDLFDQLNRQLIATLNLDLLLREVSKTLITHIKAQFCVFEVDGMKYAARRVVGAESKLSDEDMAELKAAIVKMGRRAVLVSDVLPNSPIKRLMDRNDVSMVLLLNSASNKPKGALGMIMLGPKKSGNPYAPQDIAVLSSVANELTIAIQNSRRFEEIQSFNKTLQQKVEQATNELRRTNDRLKLLDETKDEFITMASHQLRTPLTSVKGYLSMVLEGDAGKLNANQEKLLEQSYLSSQRMVYLISDLLNLSRLNTGKFVIEPSEVDLSEVAQVEVDQLDETAKARNLNLIYERPDSFPKLMLDETKIHQVVMNFIDNAIYYTPSGGTVTVALRETPAAVEYTVRDTGIGVPKAVQHKLFTKFYRAGNAQQARPDGTGLGLFMAKKVVAAQGGAIIFESEEGKGSTFGFRFNKADHAISGAVGKTNQPKDAHKQPSHH